MAAKEAPPRIIRRTDYRAPEFLIDETELVFEIADGFTVVQSRLAMRRNPAVKGSTLPLVLNGQDMELMSLSLDQRLLDAVEYSLTDTTLTIPEPGDQFVLAVKTKLVPETNTALEGLYKSGNMYCTQCEAEGFRKITYYLDRPDVMAKFRTTIIGDGAYLPVMLSNGNEVAREELTDGRRKVVWEDPFPKPAYLFALVAGDLEHIEDHFITTTGRRVVLRIYTEQHNIGKVHYAMDALKRAMAWDEEVYGREYDLDIFMIVAVDSFNMGAMENKGLNIFNARCVLATPDTTDDTGFQRVEAVVAHEYFHNWSGNRVTCRDWFQLSLKEGFTVFRDAEFSADQNSRTVKRIEDVNFLRSRQFAEDAGPMAHPVRPESYMEIANFYTSTVYEKGAEVVRMIQSLLGRELFRKGCDLYFERHDGQAVTCEDFIKAMEDTAGVDLGQFRQWYSQAGTPRVQVQESYDAERATYTLKLAQSCPPTPGQKEKEPFHILVAIGLLDSSGQELLGQASELALATISVEGDARVVNPHRDDTLIVHLTRRQHTIHFRGVAERPVLSFLRAFSAPVLVERTTSAKDLSFLMAKDSDGFCRWDAAQVLYSRALFELMEHPQQPVAEVVMSAFGRILRLAEEEDSEEKAVLAAMLCIPSYNVLAQKMDVVEVDSIHLARTLLRQQLAKRFTRELLAIYRANSADEPYTPDARSFARRSLQNTVLHYLVQNGEAQAWALAEAQFAQADNLTDRIEALKAVVWLESSAADLTRSCLLDVFYQRYAKDSLVLDDWFACQALAPQPGALERVRELAEHPAFDPSNPNKVRALLHSFCAGNPVNFHRCDGAGYDYLASWVIDLNRKNPQLATRLLMPLTSWRRYDPNRQQKMTAALQKILASSQLSTDVYEVASKSLA